VPFGSRVRVGMRRDLRGARGRLVYLAFAKAACLRGWFFVVSVAANMFELFSKVTRRPTLTKLDDDGETQMDMCKY
jgi:hypothetical protein